MNEKIELEEQEDKVYPCPLCLTVHEWVVPCMPMIDEKFRNDLLKEFKIINTLEAI